MALFGGGTPGCMDMEQAEGHTMLERMRKEGRGISVLYLFSTVVGLQWQ